MQSDVGVVIPTYNRPFETKRALESVLNQTISPSQIVIIDDGSDRESLEQLRELISPSSAKLIVIEHTGHPGIARNIGVSALDTQWVAFLDSDDQWIKNKLEVQLEYAKKLDLKAVCCNAELTNKTGNSAYFKSSKSFNLTLRKLLEDNRIITSSVLVDRKLLLSVGGVATSLSVRGAEDYATWLRVATLSNWFYIDQPLTIYFNNSSDSFRATSGFPQNYVRHFGLLDFQSWLEARKLSHSWIIRLYLRGLSHAINFAMKAK